MNRSRLALIVGGHGEYEALPILIRRIADQIDPENAVEFPVKLRVPEDRLRKSGELERYTILAARSDMPISVVLANKEYESWFLAASVSIRGKYGLPEDLETVESPEKIRGAKEWLHGRMPKNHPYTPTEHQPALTRLFDMNAAKRAPSFEKCYREIAELLSLTKE